MKTNFPMLAMSLEGLVPEGWWYSDLLMGANPARIEARVFYCDAWGCKVSCHGPVCCNEDCKAYGARRVR